MITCEICGKQYLKIDSAFFSVIFKGREHFLWSKIYGLIFDLRYAKGLLNNLSSQFISLPLFFSAHDSSKKPEN